MLPTNTQQKTDVVIVGSGPTGLMAAALLARCGISVRILDKSTQSAHESRAFGVQAKSMELLLSIGLANEFLNRGVIATGVQVYVNAKQVAELNFDDIGRTDTPYSFLLMVPQWDIEDILVQDLKQFNIIVEHEQEVVDIEQTQDQVLVRSRHANGEFLEISATYLIGADGAHSIVRKKLDIPFEGAPYPQEFLLADCKITWPLDYDHMKLFLHEQHLAFYLPLRGKDFARIITIRPSSALMNENSPQSIGSAPATLEEVQHSLTAAAGLPIQLSQPRWVSAYRIHHRGATRYSEGRIFIAGDAAHIHSPAGGQGMNTGLQDAANLVWKLTLMLKGHPAPSLLETYHAERWPVGQKVLHFTDRMFAGVSSPKKWAAQLRRIIVPIFAGIVSRVRIIRAKLFNFISQLGIHYQNNYFLSDDIATPHVCMAGRRAPNALIERNLDIFSLLTGYCFHVLAISKKSLNPQEIDMIAKALAELPTDIGLPLQTHFMTQSLMGRDPRIIRVESSQVFAAYGLSEDMPQAIFLIRPDGYIAYASGAMNVAGLKQFIQTRFSLSS